VTFYTLPHCWQSISINQEHLLYFGLSFQLWLSHH
jgi:hypothetical protein